MKRQSIYADPAELKKKNQDNEDREPELGLTDVVRTPQPQRQPHHADQQVQITKEEIIEIAKEAYEEGVEAATKQSSTHKEPAKKAPTHPPQDAKAHEEQNNEAPQQQSAQPQHEEPGTDARAQSSTHPKPGENTEEKKVDMKNKVGTQGGHKTPPNQRKEEPQEQLETIVERNNYVLFQAKSIWPIDFFPDTILIDMTKISIVHKTFFATEHVTAIPLQSVADIFLQTTAFSAALTIKYLLRTDRPGVIEPVETKILALHRHDAITAKNIIRGLILANEENIDLTKIRIGDLRKKLEELGATKTGV